MSQQTAAVLFVDPESVSRWVGIYQRDGLDGLKNNPLWGGERGSRWTVRAMIQLIQERFAVSYSQRGCRKILRALNFSSQRGRPFYNRRRPEDQARFERETLEVLEEFAASASA